MRHILLAAAFVIASFGTALAADCPKDRGTTSPTYPNLGYGYSWLHSGYPEVDILAKSFDTATPWISCENAEEVISFAGFRINIQDDDHFAAHDHEANWFVDIDVPTLSGKSRFYDYVSDAAWQKEAKSVITMSPHLIQGVLNTMRGLDAAPTFRHDTFELRFVQKNGLTATQVVFKPGDHVWPQSKEVLPSQIVVTHDFVRGKGDVAAIMTVFKKHSTQS